jgi:hypothetical protein
MLALLAVNEKTALILFAGLVSSGFSGMDAAF